MRMDERFERLRVPRIHLNSLDAPASAAGRRSPKRCSAARGDGRTHPQIPAHDLVWAVVMGHILRETSFLSLEWLARSPVRAELGIKTKFGDDTLATAPSGWT